ncbi:GNAT family N-acetyltransferase [Bacillus solitudinis]|uniref:GNAT family N-acetyltransferase n=1 Tax=Bacillus solitudinis TaxID=2014074 RepID=UPI000C242620|nr:GNAT family N-acetyltransferase [Bacillus solitudinis]
MIDIHEVRKGEIEQVSTFLLATMEEVYPFPLSDASRRDLSEMEALFIKREKATIITAYISGQVVGTIAVRPYDGRIGVLENRYHLETTCELIKCYVDKQLRQKGVGSLLFESAVQFCKQANYTTMYLHTHRFLPGGLTFWKKKGFQLIVEESQLETVHMEQDIDKVDKYFRNF